MATDLARWNQPGVNGVGALLLAFAFSSAHARDAYQCEGLLLPPEEVRATDYATLQAFAKANPTHLYDAIAKSGAGAGSFGGFSEDFKQSTSKGDFPKRAQKRLQDENFTLPDVEAKAHYRRGLSDAQLNAWAQCAAQTTREGAVLATARNASAAGFNLLVVWVPPAGVGTSSLEIDVAGGTVAGLASFQQTMTGRSFTTHEIKAASARPVKATVTIAGATDTVIVPGPKAPVPPAAKP